MFTWDNNWKRASIELTLLCLSFKKLIQSVGQYSNNCIDRAELLQILQCSLLNYLAICIFNWSTLTSENESFTKMNSLSEVLLNLVENFTQRFTIGTLTEHFIINLLLLAVALSCHTRANVIFRDKIWRNFILQSAPLWNQ